MTLDDVKLGLTKKFPQFSKADDTELAEIVDALKGYSETDLEIIWNEFRDTYAAGYAPRRAVFVKLAKDLRVFRQVGPHTAVHEFVCYVCDCRFALDLTTCPVCGNNDKNFRAVIRRGAMRMGKLKAEMDEDSQTRLRAIFPKNPTNDEKTNREQAAFLLHSRQAGPRTAPSDQGGIR